MTVRYSNSSPFIGVVLAGDFTIGLLNQLKSLDFGVLYFPYDTVVKLFEKFGVNAASDERTPEREFRHKLDDYEKKHYYVEAPDPIEAIKIRMEEMQLKQIDLADAIGGKSRVAEVLDRKRKLTVEMIRKLNPKLNLFADLLIHDDQLMR